MVFVIYNPKNGRWWSDSGWVYNRSDAKMFTSRLKAQQEAEARRLGTVEILGES